MFIKFVLGLCRLLFKGSWYLFFKSRYQNNTDKAIKLQNLLLDESNIYGSIIFLEQEKERSYNEKINRLSEELLKYIDEGKNSGNLDYLNCAVVKFKNKYKDGIKI